MTPAEHYRMFAHYNAWANDRLSPAARRHVASARVNAFEELVLEAARPVDAALVALAGIPAADNATNLLRKLRTSERGDHPTTA